MMNKTVLDQDQTIEKLQAEIKRLREGIKAALEADDSAWADDILREALKENNE